MSVRPRRANFRSRPTQPSSPRRSEVKVGCSSDARRPAAAETTALRPRIWPAASALASAATARLGIAEPDRGRDLADVIEAKRDWRRASRSAWRGSPGRSHGPVLSADSIGSRRASARRRRSARQALRGSRAACRSPSPRRPSRCRAGACAGGWRPDRADPSRRGSRREEAAHAMWRPRSDLAALGLTAKNVEALRDRLRPDAPPPLEGRRQVAPAPSTRHAPPGAISSSAKSAGPMWTGCDLERAHRDRAEPDPPGSPPPRGPAARNDPSSERRPRATRARTLASRPGGRPRRSRRPTADHPGPRPTLIRPKIRYNEPRP